MVSAWIRPTGVGIGNSKLEGTYANDQGREEPWTAYYAEYCQLIARTDRNAGNAAEGSISSVGDVLGTPGLLDGKSPGAIREAIGSAPGWREETLGQGTHEGQGWVLREYDENGNLTGRVIRWHPGGGRHGPDPYWRVSTGEGGKSGIIPGGPNDLSLEDVGVGGS